MLQNVVRILRGGTTLTVIERSMIDIAIEYLPENVKSIVLLQLREYNLIQREADGRALNFYKVKRLNKVVDPSIKLPSKQDDYPLLKLEFGTRCNDTINMVLHVVNGRLFCVNFSKPVHTISQSEEIEIKSLKESWRSMVPCS